MLDPMDYAQLRRLVDLYGYLIDERKFSRIDEVFTADVEYDASDFGHGVLRGIDAVLAMWRGEANHPLAHHAVNMLVDERGDGSVDLIVKGLGVGAEGPGRQRDLLRPRGPGSGRLAASPAAAGAPAPGDDPAAQLSGDPPRARP